MELGGFRKHKSIQEVIQTHRLGGPAKSLSGYYREGSLLSLLLVVMVMAKEILVLVGLVLGLHHGDFDTLGSRLNGQILKGLKCILVCDE
jgi:hypothetical protein